MQRERIEFRTLSRVDLLLDSIRMLSVHEISGKSDTSLYGLMQTASLIQSKGEIDDLVS